jgi:hypothetical protein
MDDLMGFIRGMHHALLPALAIWLVVILLLLAACQAPLR